MTRRPILLAACLSLAAPAPATASYAVSQTIPLGLPDRWDYVTFDPGSKHVLVAHGDHTDIVDVAGGRVLGKLEGLQGAHGQIVAPSGLIYADSGKTAELTAFDPASLNPIKTLAAGPDADGVVLEPVHNLVAVMDGDGEAVTLIDLATRSVRVTVPLGGSPEFAVADGTGLLYVNIASTGEVVRLDAGAGRVTARFPVPGCQKPHGLAIDTRTHRLFTTCVNAQMTVLDSATGRVVQTLPIGHGTDAAAFDPVRHRVFSSNYDGTLSVFDETTDGRLSSAGTVRTAIGARTMALDPGTGRVFLVTADIDPTKPPTATPRGTRYEFKPGTVKLLVLDPVTN